MTRFFFQGRALQGSPTIQLPTALTPGPPSSWNNQTLVTPRPEPQRAAWHGTRAGPGLPLSDELCAILGVAPGSVWGPNPSVTAPLPLEHRDTALDPTELAAASIWLPPALPSAAYNTTSNPYGGLHGVALTEAQRAALGAAPGAVWGTSASTLLPPRPAAPAAAAPAAAADFRRDVDAILLAAVPGSALSEEERALLGMGPGAVWGELEITDDGPIPASTLPSSQVRGPREASRCGFVSTALSRFGRLPVGTADAN